MVLACTTADAFVQQTSKESVDTHTQLGMTAANANDLKEAERHFAAAAKCRSASFKSFALAAVIPNCVCVSTLSFDVCWTNASAVVHASTISKTICVIRR